jgi:DNA-binding protein HU-beta
MARMTASANGCFAAWRGKQGCGKGTEMNKLELVTAVADKAGLTKRDAEKAVSAVVESIEEALKRGDRVSLVGFGTFEVRSRKPRVGRNPQTGQEIRIPAGKVPSFKAGKSLKESIG